jgi:D-3-phosphoglycerate dehydrogenase
MRVLITAAPFGEIDRTAIDRLEAAGCDVARNPFGRRLTEAELAELIPEVDVLVAGTEPITTGVLAAARRLQFISRVGIGLDNLDLPAARARGIPVAYTPDAPAPAVAELTIGLMLCLLRGIHHANAIAHAGGWKRILGVRLATCMIGVIGVGRTGRRVVDLAAAFGARVLANDLIRTDLPPSVTWTDKDTIYREADVVTLHVPLTTETRHLLAERELALMKPGAFLVNTARGELVDEAALARALRSGRLAGAALDVFEVEPYRGDLATIDRCLITCHMGSMSSDCRLRMEAAAVDNVLQFLRGEPVANLVPETEYALRDPGDRGPRTGAVALPSQPCPPSPRSPRS